MSTGSARWGLWLALLLTLPVPMWFLDVGWAPTMALVQISAYMAAVLATEGGPGALLAFQALGAQALLWAGLLFVLSRLTVGMLARGGDTAPTAAVGGVVVALFGLSLFDVYQTAVIARGAAVNLFGVY